MAVDFADDTDSFGGEGFLDDFGGAFGTFAQTVADKGRIGHLHQYVVYAIDVHVFQSALVHVVQNATVSQCTIKSAITI